MIKKVTTLIPLITLIALGSSWASTIDEIEVEGLKRTKKQVILDTLTVEIGQEFTQETASKIEQELLKTGLFINIDSEFSQGPEDKGLLTISLEEKWTLIPLPIFTASSSGVSGGFFLIESNLLGLRKNLVLGTLYSPDQTFVLTSFSDPRLFGTDNQGSVSGSFRQEEGIIQYSGGLGLGREFFEKTLSAGVRLSQRFAAFEDQKQTDTYTDLALRTAFDWTVLKGLTKIGWNLNMESGVLYDYQEGLWLPQGEAKLEYSGRFSKRNLFSLGASYRHTQSPLPLRQDIGGGKGSLSLPKDKYYPENHIYTTGEYAFALYEGSGVYYALNAFVERGFQDSADAFWYTGVGSGFQIILKKIALPALAFYTAYNVEQQQWETSFSIGMSF